MAVSQVFADKVVLITGAAKGIGLAVAKYVAIRGASVSLADISASSLEVTLKLLQDAGTPPDRLFFRVLDVADTVAVDAWVVETVEKFGKFDGVVNNAGVAPKIPFPITATPLDDWDRVVNTNLKGTFNCLRAQLDRISEGGSIVNVSSISGVYGNPGVCAYAASKHGILGLTKVAAKEGAARKVRVNAVCPFRAQVGPAVDPENLPQIIKRWADPSEIATVIAFLLGEESKYVTKATWMVDGGTDT